MKKASGVLQRGVSPRTPALYMASARTRCSSPSSHTNESHNAVFAFDTRAPTTTVTVRYTCFSRKMDLLMSGQISLAAGGEGKRKFSERCLSAHAPAVFMSSARMTSSSPSSHLDESHIAIFAVTHQQRGPCYRKIYLLMSKQTSLVAGEEGN